MQLKCPLQVESPKACWVERKLEQNVDRRDIQTVPLLEVFTRGKRLDPPSNQARPQVADRGMPSAVKAPGVLGS